MLLGCCRHRASEKRKALRKINETQKQIMQELEKTDINGVDDIYKDPRGFHLQD